MILLGIQFFGSPLPPSMTSRHSQKGQTSTFEILLPRTMGEMLPSQVTLLLTASEACALKQAVQSHDEGITSYHHEISSQCWNRVFKYTAKRNSLCFYWIRSNHHILTKTYSCEFISPATAQMEGRHYTSRQLEKSSSCYICSNLTVLQYLWILTSLCHQGKKKVQ